MWLHAALKSGRFMRCSRMIADGLPVQFPPDRKYCRNSLRASSAADSPHRQNTKAPSGAFVFLGEGMGVRTLFEPGSGEAASGGA